MRPLKFFPIGAPRRSKLALRLPPGSVQTVLNLTLPAISNAHSVLIELFCHWNSEYQPVTANRAFIQLNNAVANEAIYLYLYNGTNQIVFFLNSVVGGVDQATRIPYPPDGTKAETIALLLDRTNNRKIIFENGSIQANDPIGAVNPDLSAINNRFYIATNSTVPVDLDNILTRVTVLSSVPADIADIMAWQHRYPMELHPTLQGLAIGVASQFDFESQLVDDGGHAYRTVEDHGSIGGYNLTSTVDLEDRIKVAEKCKPVRPPRTFYSFDDAHYGVNANFGGHGIQGGAHIVQLLFPRYQKMITYPATNHYAFYLLDTLGNQRIAIYSTTATDFYTVWVRNGATSRFIYTYNNLRDAENVVIAIEGTNVYVLFDGQQIGEDNAVLAPDFTGLNLSMYLSGSGTGFNHITPIYRHWNYPAGVLPVGWQDEAKRRVLNPWDRSTLFGDDNLRLEYLMDVRSNPSGTQITNSAQPGVGDLTISPAGLFGNVVRKYRVAHDVYESKVRLESTGDAIDPETTVAGTPLVLWDFEEWGMSGDPDPGTIDFLYAAARSHSLEANPWGSVEQLRVEADTITRLDNLRLLTGLTYLSCGDNAIAELDVSELTTLTYLLCYNNTISVLDVSALISLVYLACGDNAISVLDVSALTALTYLACYDNSISVLDVAALVNLRWLYCNDNAITALDVSALTALEDLYCANNAIGMLDLTALSNLLMVFCGGNNLPSSVIDAMLIALDGHGQINGVCDTAGQVPPAPPGPLGVTARNNLIGKGWAVVTD